MKLTLNILKRCQDANISLEQALVLYLVSQEQWIPDDSLKNLEIEKELIRQLFIDPNTRKSTDVGKVLLFHLLSDEEDTPLAYTQEFEEFWKLFPTSDKFAHYDKTRNIRGEKRATFVEWMKAIGHTPGSQIIKTLKKEIEERSQESARTNAFKFMKGSVKWLADKVYENYNVDEPAQTYQTDDII